MKFPPFVTLRISFLAILAGMFGAQWLNFTKFSAEIFLGAIIFMLAASLLKRKIWLFCGLALVGIWYSQISLQGLLSSDKLQNSIGEIVRLEGTITSFPDIRKNDQRLYISVSNLQTKAQYTEEFSAPIKIRSLPASGVGKLLLILPKNHVFDYGDQIVFEGKLTKPPYVPDFDYARHLRRFGVLTMMKNPRKISQIPDVVGGNWLLRKSKQARNWLAGNISAVIPAPHSTIALGVLLGVKSELPEWLQSDFRRSGLMHLLVVSGSNVALVLVLLGLILKRFGARIMLIGGSLGLAFFVGMTGADPPVVRAALMGGLVLFGMSFGRSADMKNIVLFSAVLIGLANPLTLQQDIGFFLSFAATLSIITLYPWVESQIDRLENFRGFSVFQPALIILSVSLVAQLGVTPILSLTFGELSLASLVSNLLAEPLIPLIMGLSFTASFLGMIPILGTLVGWAGTVLIEILLWIAKIFALIPVISVPENVSLFLLFLWAGVMIWQLVRDFLPARPFWAKSWYSHIKGQ